MCMQVNMLSVLRKLPFVEALPSDASEDLFQFLFHDLRLYKISFARQSCDIFHFAVGWYTMLVLDAGV